MKKAAIIVVVAIVILIGIGAMGSDDEPKFNEEELVGMTLLEAEPILDESGYDLTMLSQTGVEMNSDLGSIDDWQLEQWYVYECDADHENGRVTIVAIDYGSELMDEIK